MKIQSPLPIEAIVFYCMETYIIYVLNNIFAIYCKEITYNNKMINSNSIYYNNYCIHIAIYLNVIEIGHLRSLCDIFQ